MQNASLLVGAEKLEQTEDNGELSSKILPPEKRMVTFKAGDNLTMRLLHETRRINVPFASPDDDQSHPEPQGDDELEQPQQHRAAATGHAGSHETRITASGGIARRTVRTLANIRDEDDPFDLP